MARLEAEVFRSFLIALSSFSKVKSSELEASFEDFVENIPSHSNDSAPLCSEVDTDFPSTLLVVSPSSVKAHEGRKLFADFLAKFPSLAFFFFFFVPSET